MTDSKEIGPFHPVVSGWFRSRFGEPTAVQAAAWRRIVAGEHTLIAAPTGSGKTLAALLPCLDRVVRAKLGEGDAAAAALEASDARCYASGVRVLYVTPLKALNNDIHHHIFRFTAEMSQLAAERGAAWPGLGIGVRTGDTSQSTRASMLRHPPELLITTPESLYLMLTSKKGREMLRTVRQVVVDEIHDLAPDKRGVHLSLSLERLTELCGRTPQRIGVSATQKPMERVARFLGGWDGEGAPRPVAIVEAAMEKRLELSVTMPVTGVRALDKDAVWTPLVERLLERLEGSRTALLFVNNRRLCERLTLRLNDYVGYEMARSHHGSVSREQRLEVESLLKSGKLRCLVATATLELGIDVGHVDLVIQVDSPKEAAAGIQRIGRAGHAVGGVSHGLIVVRGRGDLAETAVLAKAIAERDIEELRIPRHALDVLAQQTVAEAAAGPCSAAGLFRIFCRSDCYRDFPWERFVGMLDVLTGLYPFVKPLLRWSRSEDQLSALPAAAMAASMGAGVIPSSSAFPVHHADSRVHLGELDEEFVYESRVGDVFQLGTGSWMIRSVKPDRIYVSEASNRLSEIPFWRAEAGGRSAETGLRIGRLLDELASAGRDEAQSEALRKRLMQECRLEEQAARELQAYVSAQASSGVVPTDTRIVSEHYKDDAGRHHLVLHSLFGRRVNRTWEMALRSRFETLTGLPIYSNARDDGVELVFPDWDPAWVEELGRLAPDQAERLIWELLPASSMLGRAFREIAETSLLLAKGFQRQASWIKRYRSQELLKESLPYADRFPFLREAYASVLEERLDVPGLKALLTGIREGRLVLRHTEPAAPSPFAVRFMQDYAVTALYESDALSRDVQLRLLNVNRRLASAWFGGQSLKGLLTPAVVEEVRGRLEGPPQVQQTADTEAALARLLKERGDLGESELAELVPVREEELQAHLLRLEREDMAARIMVVGEERWIAANELGFYEALAAEAAESDALRFVLLRYAGRRLAVSEAELAARYGLSRSTIAEWVAAMREEGLLEASPFEPDSAAGVGEEAMYTASKVAEQLVRASVLAFRNAHQAVEAERYAAWLLRRHRLTPALQLEGEEGLLAAVETLQGVFLPLSYWEAHLFPARVKDYRKELLDALCATGQVLWMGGRQPEEKEGRVAFFLAESKELAAPYLQASEAGAPSQHPDLVQLLKRKGASFLTALARETGELPSELLDRLLTLAWEGRAANDQFAPLRTAAASAAAPGSGRGAKSGGTAVPAGPRRTGAARPSARSSGFQSGLGRWYALEPEHGPGPVLPGAPAERAAELGAGDSSCAAGVQAAELQSGAAGLGAPTLPDAAEAAMAYCRHMLSVYGLLTRRVSAALQLPYGWDRFSELLKRLEDWGMVTRGFYVQGIPAMQFASPEQVESLQAAPADTVSASASGASALQVTLLSACDPANPYGAWVDWPEDGAAYARKPGHFLVYEGERWELWLESQGKAVWVRHPDRWNGPEGQARLSRLLAHAFRLLMARYHLRKVAASRWNGRPAGASEGVGPLEAAGAERDRDTLVLWPSALRLR